MSDLIHVSPVSLPDVQVVTSYLSLRDQDGQPWFLWIDDSGSPILTDRRPDGLDLASRQSFSWLRWQSPDGTPWYIWPSPFYTLLFSTERPMGEGTGALFARWWSPGRRLWTVTVSNAPALLITGDDVAQVATAHSLLACRVCSWCGHLDTSNALRDLEGNPLLDRCPRDGRVFYPEDEADG